MHFLCKEKPQARNCIFTKAAFQLFFENEATPSFKKFYIKKFSKSGLISQENPLLVMMSIENFHSSAAAVGMID